MRASMARRPTWCAAASLFHGGSVAAPARAAARASSICQPPRFTRDTWRLPETCSCASPRTAAEAGHDPAFPLRASTSTRASVPCPVRVAEGHWLSPANFIAPCATPAVPDDPGVAQPGSDTPAHVALPPRHHTHITTTAARLRCRATRASTPRCFPSEGPWV